MTDTQKEIISLLCTLTVFWTVYFQLAFRFRKVVKFTGLVVPLIAMSVFGVDWPVIELRKRYEDFEKYAPHWKLMIYFWRPLSYRVWLKDVSWFNQLEAAETRKNQMEFEEEQLSGWRN